MSVIISSWGTSSVSKLSSTYNTDQSEVRFFSEVQGSIPGVAVNFFIFKFCICICCQYSYDLKNFKYFPHFWSKSKTLWASLLVAGELAQLVNCTVTYNTDQSEVRFFSEVPGSIPAVAVNYFIFQFFLFASVVDILMI